MAFPKYYLFDQKLPGSMRVVFDDHVTHANNFREHLEGFVALLDPTFDVHGIWRRPNVLVYANGIPNRMRDGIVWIMPIDTRKSLTEWISKTKWPTDEKTMLLGVHLPGRWLTEEEAARQWIEWQGISPDVPKSVLEKELEHRGVRMSRFSEHLRNAPRDED